MPNPTLTTEDLDRLEAEHFLCADTGLPHFRVFGSNHCAGCQQQWPCLMGALVAGYRRMLELEAATQKPTYCETYAAYGYRCEPPQEKPNAD